MSSAALHCFIPRPHAQCRLFCLHHAGGSFSTFKAFAEGLPPTIEVWAFQWPGHDGRMGEPCETSLSRLGRSFFTALAPYMDIPFAFYGHSLGGLVAWELARLCHQQNNHMLRHLFLFGSQAPHRSRQQDRPCRLDDDQLIHWLCDLDPTLGQHMKDPMIRDLFLPILRSDLGLSESIAPPSPWAMPHPISVLIGEMDTATSLEELQFWQDWSTIPLRSVLLPCGHFMNKKGLVLALNHIEDTLVSQ